MRTLYWCLIHLIVNGLYALSGSCLREPVDLSTCHVSCLFVCALLGFCVQESVENLKRAVEVLRSAVVNPTPSTSSQAHPYLPPTLPLSATQGGDAKGTSGSGGLRGTGTHFMLPAAPAPQQQPGSAAARAAGASADAATGSNEPLPPPAAAARPQAARLHVPRGGGAAGAPQIEEAAVSHFARPQRRSRFAHDVAGAAAVGTGAGAGVGLGLNGAAIAAGVVCGSGGDVSQGLDEPGVTNNKQHGDHEHDHDPDMPTGTSAHTHTQLHTDTHTVTHRHTHTQT